ncbi:MAG: ABC transporter substrate-binding protein, partial [Thermoplasmata archaeon]
MRKRWVEVSGFALVVCALLLAASFSSSAAPDTRVAGGKSKGATPYGGVFKIGFMSDVKALNPCVPNDVWSWAVLDLIYESLSVPSKQTGEPIPWIAENWTMDTEDGLNWTVRIRQGIKWHDGMPLTADDVVFSYNFQITNYPCGFNHFCIDLTPLPGATDRNETYYNGIQKVDTYTVKFVLWKRCSTFFSHCLAIPILPKHIWRNHWDDKTSWNMDYNPVTGEANVIGSGPFKFKYWKQGVEVKIERNPDYFAKTILEDGNQYRAPFVDAIQIFIYQNMDAMVTALKQGAIDYIWWSIDPSWIPVISQISGTKVFVNADRGYYYLGFNLMHPFEGYDEGTGYQPRHDENDPITYPNPQAGNDAGLAFRRAVAHCIDKDYIVSQLLQGLGEKGVSVVPPSYSLWYNDSLPQYPYNITRAKAILDAANYNDTDADGWREDYTGRKMGGGQIEILTPPVYYDPVRAEAGKLIANAMRLAGINAVSQPTAFGEIVDSVFVNRTFEMFILGWRLGPEPDWLYDFFHSKFDWYNPAIGDGGNNPHAYRNQEYDTLVSQIETEMNLSRRVQIVKDCQGIIAHDMPVNVLYYRSVVEVADTSEWTGYHDMPGGIGNFWTMREVHHPVIQPQLCGYLWAEPAHIPGIKNATLRIIASLVNPEGAPYPNVSVNISFSPALNSQYFTIDATQKKTGADGKAVFLITCIENYPQDTVFRATAEVTDGVHNATAETYFAITMPGLNVEVTSPTIVEGTAGNVFWLNVTVRQFADPLPGAQVEFQTFTPPENLKAVVVRANTDENGTAALKMQVTGNFTYSTPVEVKYTVWPAGGAKTVYNHHFVVLANGGTVVTINVEEIGVIEGVSGKTKEVNVTVAHDGSQLSSVPVYAYLTPFGRGLNLLEEMTETGNNGEATFTLQVETLFTIPMNFKFLAIVASNTCAGYAEATVRVSAVSGIEAGIEITPAVLNGTPGQEATVNVRVTASGMPVADASVLLDFSPATTSFQVLPSIGYTNTTGVATFNVRVVSEIPS